MKPVALLLLVSVLLLGSACTAVPSRGSNVDAAGPRMMLTWYQDVPAQAQSIAAFEAEISRIATTRVHRIAAVSVQIQIVSIDCDSAAVCDAAARRLSDDSRVIALVPDRRSRRHGTAASAANQD